MGYNLMREQIGENIKQARLKRGLTQEEVARDVGVTVRNYQRWERGLVTPYYRNLQAIAFALDVEEAELLGDMPREIGTDSMDARLTRLQRDIASLDGRAHDMIAFKRDVTARLDRIERLLNHNGPPA